QQISKTLMPKGIMYIEMPHRDDEFKDDVFPHTLFFSGRALSNVAQRAGLEVLKVETFGLRGSGGKAKLPMRLRNAFWSRIFRIMVRLNWRKGIFSSNQALMNYRIREDGSWLRGAFLNLEH
ncbi:MAG: hypothetical protein ABL958_19090, partial [Bdellovibrionia bacterium]